MTCPSCSMKMADGAAVCPGCGVDFAKWQARAERKIKEAWGASAPLPNAATPGAMLTGNLIMAAVALAIAGGAVWGVSGYFQRRNADIAAAIAAKAAAEEAKRLEREEADARAAQEAIFAAAIAAAQPKEKPKLPTQAASVNKMTPQQEAMWRYGIAVSQENRKRQMQNAGRR